MRHAQHLQVTLQQTGLSRCAVLHDIGKVELDFLSQHHHGEVRLVHLRLCTLREGHAHGIGLAHGHQFPLAEAGENFIDVVFELVDAGGGELSAAARNLPLGGVAAINDGNRLILGHFLFEVIIFKVCFFRGGPL